MSKFSKSKVWDKFQRKVPSFFEIPIFSYSTVWVGWKEGSVPKISSIRPVVLIHYRLVTDRQTDGQTHDDSTYRACIASHGKTRRVFDVGCIYGNYVVHWSVTQNFLFCTRAADLAGGMPGAQLNKSWPN